MNISLGERIWFDHMRAIVPEYVRLIGRVIGEVQITDINKRVFYNRIIDIPATEANRSQDLLNAVAKKWVEIVQGKEHLKNLTTNNYSSEIIRSEIPIAQQTVQQNVDLKDIKNYIDKTLQTSTTAILDQLKVLQSKDNNFVVKSDIDKNTIAAIVEQLADKISIEKPVQKDIIKLDKPEDVFINLDEDKELKTNINEDNLGIVTTKEDKKAKSIAKKLKTIKGD